MAEALASPRPRVADLTALGLVAATVLAGPAVLPQLPAEMVVGWHLGLGGEWSATRAPRLVGLVVIPALSAAFYGGRLVVRALAARTDGLDPGTVERRVLDVGTNLALALACVAQLALIWLNL